MRLPPGRPMHFAGLALALGLAACGGDSTAPRSDSIAEEDAEAVGYAVMGSLYGSAFGLTYYEFSLGGPLFSRAPAGAALARRGNIQFFSPTSCPSFSPDPFPDADEDGVPDNTIFSFDSESCDETDEFGTTDYHGNVIVSDPGTTLGYDLEIDGLGITFTPVEPADPSEGIEWDGFRQLRGSSSSISLAEEFDFRYQVDGSTLLRLLTQWDVDFLAETPGAIAFGSPLPDGELDVDGGLRIEAEGHRFILVVNTVAPLAWDAVCQDFVAGMFRVWAQGREAEAAVQVTFNGCGVEPTIVYLQNPV